MAVNQRVTVTKRMLNAHLSIMPIFPKNTRSKPHISEKMGIFNQRSPQRLAISSSLPSHCIFSAFVGVDTDSIASRSCSTDGVA